MILVYFDALIHSNRSSTISDSSSSDNKSTSVNTVGLLLLPYTATRSGGGECGSKGIIGLSGQTIKAVVENNKAPACFVQDH